MNQMPEVEQPNCVAGQNLAVDPPPRRRRPDLATLSAVRREMGRVYRDMRAKKIESQDGTRFVYVLTAIGKLIEGSEMQKRVEALEQRLLARNNH
jgi:hypothetical protein